MKRSTLGRHCLAAEGTVGLRYKPDGGGVKHSVKRKSNKSQKNMEINGRTAKRKERKGERKKGKGGDGTSEAKRGAEAL